MTAGRRVTEEGSPIGWRGGQSNGFPVFATPRANKEDADFYGNRLRWEGWAPHSDLKTMRRIIGATTMLPTYQACEHGTGV